MPLFDVKGTAAQPKQKKPVPVKSTSTDGEYVPTFMYEGQFAKEEEEVASRIQQRRIQMLLHSRIYYELNNNIVPDAKWNKWALELVELQKQHPDIAARICFADAFKDWDGTTGAFLPLTHPWVVRKVAQSYRR